VNVLAADVGGTSIRAHLVSEDGRSLARRAAPTPQDPAEGIALLRSFWDELGGAAARALVIAGGIRAATGEITQSPNLPRWEGTRPGEALSCVVLNDANGALVGEAWKGALVGRRSAILLTLGTGVGGGVLLEGRLWTGARGSAGEIGHVPVRPDGPPCGCGGRGCLELYASARAVAKAAGTRDAEEAARLAREGEPRSRGAFARAGEALGIALAGAVNVLNPEAICLGGGMAAAFDLLEPHVRAELATRAFRLATEALEIVPAALGGDAGILGAAKAALDAAGGSR
jgi:glucokinase